MAVWNTSGQTRDRYRAGDRSGAVAGAVSAATRVRVGGSIRVRTLAVCCAGAFELVPHIGSAHGAAGWCYDQRQTHVRLERLLISYLTDPTSVEGNPEDEVRGAIPFLEAGGDHGGLATAWRLIVNLQSADAQWGASGDAARRWIEQARLAGDQVMEVRAGTALALAALFDPTPVPLAIASVASSLAARRGIGDRKP